MDTPESKSFFNLNRFVEAQDAVYAEVCAELRNGEKTGHWMWFIFPQLRGLGHSEAAQRFGIASPEEGKAYLEHPILGPRLRECTVLVNNIKGRTLNQVFGYPDDLKFRSSMSLFAILSEGKPENRIFKDGLDKYCGGEFDPPTVRGLPPSGRVR